MRASVPDLPAPLRLELPLTLFLDEADQVAAAFVRHRAKLRSVAIGRLSDRAPDEILALVAEIRRAGTQRSPAASPSTAVQRARARIAEIIAVAKFAARVRADAKLEHMLERMRQDHPPRIRTASSVAAALQAYSRFAESNRGIFDGVGGFKLQRATELDALLNELSGRRGSADATLEKRKRETAARNELIRQLRERIADVRAAARFVFRDEPAVVREFTSAYSRRRRRLSRSAKNATPAPVP